MCRSATRRNKNENHKKTMMAIIAPALLLWGISLEAQTQEPNFLIVETMRTVPNKNADYEKVDRKVWKKIHQERIKRGLIVSWNLFAAKYPSGTNAPYDYVTVTVIQGMKKVENPYGTMFTDIEKLLTKDEYTATMNIFSLRNLTNSSVYYTENFVAADPKSTTPARYQMVNMMKVKEGKSEEYIKMETKVVKPIHVEMMKSGGKSAWGLYSLMMPNGEN